MLAHKGSQIREVAYWASIGIQALNISDVIQRGHGNLFADLAFIVVIWIRATNAL